MLRPRRPVVRTRKIQSVRRKPVNFRRNVTQRPVSQMRNRPLRPVQPHRTSRTAVQIQQHRTMRPGQQHRLVRTVQQRRMFAKVRQKPTKPTAVSLSPSPTQTPKENIPSTPTHLERKFAWTWNRRTRKWQRNKFGIRNPVHGLRESQNENQSERQNVIIKSESPKLLLHPNRTPIDLFDKSYRSRIIESFDRKENLTDLPFPPELGQMFAISIRPTRLQNLRARLGVWSKHLNVWPGTVGSTLDKDKMIREGVVRNKELRRGEIGCYDAHVRLWQYVIQNKIPRALILEDDADLQCTENNVKRIRQFFNDLERFNLEFEVLYLGHNDVSWNRPMGIVAGTEIGVPRQCQGLFTYVLTLAGAQKLLQTAYPMEVPIDIYVANKKSTVKQYTIEPRLNSVVKIEKSDTNTVL
jgi:glycosyl transferase family 25